MKHGPLCENFSGLSEHLRSALRIVIELNAKVECKGLLGKYHLIDSPDAIDLTDLSKSDVFTQGSVQKTGTTFRGEEPFFSPFS